MLRIKIKTTGKIVNKKGLQEITIKYKRVEFIINNNSGKYSRVFLGQWAGPNPTNEQKLAYYDHFAGLILLAENREEVKQGQFWLKYKNKIELKERLNVWCKYLKEITSHPVISTLLIILFIYLMLRCFNIDLRNYI